MAWCSLQEKGSSANSEELDQSPRPSNLVGGLFFLGVFNSNILILLEENDSSDQTARI